MEPSASLRPLAGEPAEICRLLEPWLVADHAEAVTVRTSGTTGQPKEVRLSAAAVTASAAATLARLGGPGQWVLALPVRYVAGLQVLVRSILAGTIPVDLAQHPGVAVAERELSHRRRYLALVPTQLYRLLADPIETEALARFDAVLVGGGATDRDLLDQARAAGVRIVTTYGMSETCGGCVYDGLPLDGVRVRLGRDGRVLIGGPVLFDGYVDNDRLTARLLRDGWLHTPDVGRLDPATGRLEVVGRLDDVIVSGGTNVPSAAVERRIREHPAIREVAVVGVGDREWGARVVAFVVTTPGAEPPTTDELRDHVAQAHPREWAPREVVVLPALPLTESGKPDRRALAGGLASRRA